MVLLILFLFFIIPKCVIHINLHLLFDYMFPQKYS